MTKQETQDYIHNHFDTMATIIGNRFCVNKNVVKRWLNKMGYTSHDFGKVLTVINDDFEGWLAQIIVEVTNLEEVKK